MYRRTTVMVQWLSLHASIAVGFRSDPWDKIPQAAWQLTLCTTTNEPALWSPRATTTEPTGLSY